jgi:hypothetical protein
MLTDEYTIQMKNIILLIFSISLIFTISCKKKIDASFPPPQPKDTMIVVNDFDYYINATIGGTKLNMKSNVNNVGNGVFKEDLAPCGLGSTMKFTSYFAYVSDTSKKESISFGLTNCIHDTSNGTNDSTYLKLSFPMEISYPDTSIAFINYIDSDSVFWSSSLGKNGLTPQASHSFTVTEIDKNFDGFSTLKVKGSFSGWIYNVNGDSLLVSAADFYSRAWAL